MGEITIITTPKNEGRLWVAMAGSIYKKDHLSSVIYFRHNDMQDCVIKLGKWYRTAVAEARGRFFARFFRGSSRKPTLSRISHIIHGL